MVLKDRIKTILEPRTYRKDHITKLLYNLNSTLNLMKHSWYHRRILPYTLYIVYSKQLIAHGKIFVLTEPKMQKFLKRERKCIKSDNETINFLRQY